MSLTDIFSRFANALTSTVQPETRAVIKMQCSVTRSELAFGRTNRRGSPGVSIGSAP